MRSGASVSPRWLCPHFSLCRQGSPSPPGRTETEPGAGELPGIFQRRAHTVSEPGPSPAHRQPLTGPVPVPSSPGLSQAPSRSQSGLARGMDPAEGKFGRRPGGRVEQEGQVGHTRDATTRNYMVTAMARMAGSEGKLGTRWGPQGLGRGGAGRGEVAAWKRSLAGEEGAYGLQLVQGLGVRCSWIQVLQGCPRACLRSLLGCRAGQGGPRQPQEFVL